MLKNKLWILLFVASCAPQNPPRLVTGSWMQKQKSLSAQRLPASEANATCKKDLYITSEVKKEALQYEAQLNTGEKISGHWKHLNLEKLPIPQAKFLKEVGDDLGDVNSSDDDAYARCKDAVCVINTVYQSRDELEGWVIYLWYLKMGNVLSFKNKIFNQNDPRGGVYNNASYALKDYLFSREELQVFWRLADLLPVSFKTLPNLKEIQRLPKDAKFEAAEFAESCGLSYSQGYILLNVACMDLFGPTRVIKYGGTGNPIDYDEAMAHDRITHELAHQIDFQWGSEGQVGIQFSTTGPWKDLGQWRLQEYRNSNGSFVQQWSTTLDSKYFVSEYARKNPIEHFAETAGSYYYAPEKTKETVPEKTYQFMSREVFKGVEYDKMSSIKRFEKTALLKLTPQLLDLRPDCANSLNDEDESALRPGSVKKRPVIFPRRKPQSVEESPCLSRPLERLLTEAVALAKLENTDGCLVLKSPKEEALFRADMKAAFIDHLENHSKVSFEDQVQKEQLEQFYKKMSEDRSLPLKVLTDCHGQKKEKECYEEGLQGALEESAPRDLRGHEAFETLQKNYMAANSYEDVKEENQQLYRDFIFSQAAQIDASAASLWKDCLAVDYDTAEAPLVGPFSVGEKWMVSSQFNCINKEIPLRLKRLITEMTFDAMRVADETESAILFDLTQPLLVKELGRLYEKEAKREEEQIKNSIQKLRPQQVRLLTQSLSSWVAGLGKKMQESCAKEVAKKLPQHLRYFNEQEVYKSYTQEVCSQVASSETFKNWVKSRPDLMAQDVSDTYLEALAQEAEKKADRCEEAYPANNFITRLFKREKRSRCYQEKWEEVETTAWNEASKKYRSSSFQRSVLLEKIASEAQAIKDDVQVRRF